MCGFRGVLEKEASKDLEALDEALTRLAAEDPAKAELVKLRFFAGLTMPEIARVLKISPATAERHWTYKLFQEGAWLRVFEVPVPLLKQHLTPAPDSLPSSRIAAIPQIVEIIFKQMRGLARIPRIEYSE